MVFVQVVLLSATMPVEVLDVTTRFMREPIRILVKKEELTLEGIRQFYIFVDKEVVYVLFWPKFRALSRGHVCVEYNVVILFFTSRAALYCIAQLLRNVFDISLVDLCTSSVQKLSKLHS